MKLQTCKDVAQQGVPRPSAHGQTTRISVSQIEICDRLRDTKPGVVKAIAGSFATSGQLQPIGVRFDGPKPRLVWGAHRVAAAKLLDWAEIDAKAINLDGLSSLAADLVCSIAEVDENVGRGDLDNAERVLFYDARITLTAKRIALEKLEAETRSCATANTRAEKDRALHRKKRAERAAKRATASSLANDETIDRLPNEVLDHVAQETGLATGTLKNARSLANAIGRDILRTMAGTDLATKAEMEGYVKLKKLAPVIAANCMRDAACAKKHLRSQDLKKRVPMAHSPVAYLRDIQQQAKRATRDDVLATEAGRLKGLAVHTREIKSLLGKARTLWWGLPVETRNKLNELERLQNQFDQYDALVGAISGRRTS